MLQAETRTEPCVSACKPLRAILLREPSVYLISGVKANVSHCLRWQGEPFAVSLRYKRVLAKKRRKEELYQQSGALFLITCAYATGEARMRTAREQRRCP